MNKLYPDDLMLKQIQIPKLVDWVTARGWKLLEHLNEKLWVFSRQEPLDAEALTLLLPRTHDFQDSALRLREAIDLLVAIHQIAPATLLHAVSDTSPLDSAPEGSERKTMKIIQIGGAILCFILASLLNHFTFPSLAWDIIGATIQGLAIYGLVRAVTVEIPIAANQLLHHTETKRSNL